MPHYMLSKTRLISQAGFRDRWVRLMAWLMAGWSLRQAASLYGRLVELSLIPVRRPDVEAILKQHKTHGHPVILVSSMFEGIVQRFADVVGADTGLGSVVEFRDGVCAGRVVGPTCSGAHKVDVTRRYLEQHHPNLRLADCAAYSDSRSDVAFLAGAGYPVATYPDDGMRAAARDRGWMVYEGE
jgi:putative phosphoserine phosphatase/1-acylglycerol-3-phosphate O-acyltransferase